MWTWAPEGNAGAATRTATKLWNDPEYNNLRSGLASARESLGRGLGCRGVGSQDDLSAEPRAITLCLVAIGDQHEIQIPVAMKHIPQALEHDRVRAVSKRFSN